MRTHSTLTKTAAIAIAMTAAFSLSGCFANPLDQITDKIGSEIAEGGAEKLVEGMTGGEFDMANGTLPEGFPSEVPIIDGEIVASVKLGDSGRSIWSVTFNVDDVTASMESAREKLLGAGFEETMWSEASGMPVGMFGSEAHTVLLGGVDDGEDTIVTYQVSETGAE